MCVFTPGGSVGYKTLCVRWDATTGTATDAVCLLARERTERRAKGSGRGRESCGFEEIAPILFSPIHQRSAFCRAIIVSRTAIPRNRDIKEADYSVKDGDDLSLDRVSARRREEYDRDGTITDSRSSVILIQRFWPSLCCETGVSKSGRRFTAFGFAAFVDRNIKNNNSIK